MEQRLRPETAPQVEEAIAWALSSETPLELLTTGSKRGLGRPLQVGYGLDLSALSGITLYEPEELVLSAGPATPLADIEATLEAQRQELAFEPMDLGPLYGGPMGAGSLAGVVACNLAGPRRISKGAARDHLLGFEGVTGRGETIKSGGRVMKNVTGYDLSKLMTGSFGTLAALTAVTLKVLPRAEMVATLVLAGVGPAEAVAALSAALGSPNDVSGAAYLPAGRDGAEAAALIRVEGTERSVAARIENLRGQPGIAECDQGLLDDAASRALWRRLRDVEPLAERGTEAAIWRVSLAPSDAPHFLAALEVALDFAYFLDWGGGLVWIETAVGEDAGAAALRQALTPLGGHATLMRAPDAIRLTVPVFEPQDAASSALAARVKAGFDPKGILNPGRMQAAW